MRRLEAKLGFDKVRAAISDRCQTAYAAERVAKEEFCTDPGQIRLRLRSTDEMRLVVMFEDSFPTTGYVEPNLKPLEKEGSCIDQLNMARLQTLLGTERKLVHFFDTVKDSVYPCLKDLSQRILIFPEISRRIDEILDRYGEIRDTASPELKEIRDRLKAAESSIARTAGKILAAAQGEGLIDRDAQVVVRDGKYLLPVPSAAKRKVAGFVYDSSATGKTTFIEPAEVVALENEIAALRADEAREIARILQEFTEFLRPYVPDLLEGQEAMGEFDFLLAKAQTALDYVAGMPVVEEDGRMDLRKARHPLLEKALKSNGREMQPLTISLTPEKRILLISGPNAGGKSVCLKTAGLLQYMMQWGMLIPTSESSEMCVFDRIVVSIGDDQSLENDLSTYSSFLQDMRGLLKDADAKTLVLIDEFGSGTEPTAGGAIAEAILAELDRRGAYGVITTHYTNLKLYASGADTHVVNGAMLYDTASISPMFKLEIGMPGNSFAFELARKMRLPESIVKDAEARAGEEFVDIERNLRRIVRGRRVLDEKIRKVQHTDKALEDLMQKHQSELDDIQARRKEILDEAREQAEEIVKGAGRQVEKTIRDIKESQADKQKTKEARQERQGFVQALEKKKVQVERKAARSEPLKIGEKVRVKSNGMVGEVVKTGPKSVTVEIGSITSKMSEDKLERISSNEYREQLRKTQPQITLRRDPAIEERRFSFKPEIDLRVARLQEALDATMRFIDDAIMLNMNSVRILHGKGTGVLRDELQKYIRTVPGVAQVSDEDIRHGGTGVTIVNFD